MSWTYAFDPTHVDFRALRSAGFRRDPLDPYLYFFEVRDDRALHSGGGSRAGAQAFPGFPLKATPSDASPMPAEEMALRIFMASGKPRDVWYFMFTPSGRVLLYDYETTLELTLSPDVVPDLLEELEQCGVCGLNPRLPKSDFGARSLVVELRPHEPTTCATSLSWENWHSDVEARRCFDAIHSALAPLVSDGTRSRFP